MRLEVRRFFENDDIKSDIDYEFAPDDELISSPIHVTGSIKNSAGIVSLAAEAAFSVKTQCAKCAKDIEKQLSVAVTHFLISHFDNEENDEYILVEDMVLDLDELIMEDIYLDLPSVFLCKDDCKGLCPTCGKDLNEGECGCKKAVDPRLSALAELLNDN